MTRNQHALLAMSLLLAASILDMAVTLHFSPTLSREANPLVTGLGFGLAGLAAVNVLILVAIAGALAVYAKGPRSNPPVPAKDPWELAGLNLYGRSMSRSGFYGALLTGRPLPSDLRELVRLAGFITAWGVAAARLAAVAAWLLLSAKGFIPYKELRLHTQIAGHPLLELLIGLIVATVMIQVFACTEFRLADGGGSARARR